MQSKAKGRDAAATNLRLGIAHVRQHRASTGHRVSDLVAEPMAEPGRGCYRCCKTFWWLVCRSILITTCFITCTVTVLDVAFYNPLGSMEAFYHEPNDRETLVPTGWHEQNANGLLVDPVTTALNQTGEPSWPKRFSAAFTVEFSGVSDGYINMTLLGDEATIIPADDALTTRQREQISKHAMQLLRTALTERGEAQQLDFSGRHLQTVLDDSSLEHVDDTSVLSDHDDRLILRVTADSRASEPSKSSSSVVSVKNLSIICALALTLFVSSIICGMQQNPFRPQHTQHHNHGGPRTGIGHSDAGPPFVGTATLKCPPSWSVERNHVYSLRSWIADLVLWSSATEVDGYRQGPIAAMQIQGSARELVRELTPQQLRDGDGQNTGLMLLVQLLANRYAPLGTEDVTKSIGEFLNFKRMPNESIDSVLVRYDILRNRAQQRAGFMINITGLAWLLLQALQLNAESWDRLLAPLGGQMPADELQLNDLMERIRRLYHLREGRMSGPNQQQQGATGDPGTYFAEGYFPTFAGGAEHHDMSTPRANDAFAPPASSAFACGGPNPPDPWSAHLNSTANTHAYRGNPWDVNAHVFHAGKDEVCPTCGVYFQDDGCSTDTSSDDGAVPENYGDTDGAEIYQDYVFARKRWRKFSGRGPRRYRRTWNQGKGFKKSYAAFLPPSAFAGGKGKGGGGKNSGANRKNPRDKSGQIMKCNKCGSDEHLWRRCPQNGADASRPAFVAGTSPPAMALMTSRPGAWNIGANGVLPGVHFHTQLGNVGSLGLELEQLRSVSQASSVVSGHSAAQRTDIHTATETPRHSKTGSSHSEPPSWTPGNCPSSSGIRRDPATGRALDDEEEVVPLIAGARAPAFPPPLSSPMMPSRKRDRQSDDEIRRANAEGLQRLLVGFQQHQPDAEPEAQRPRGMFPWWECKADSASLAVSDGQGIFHLRTRRHDGTVGLLVDPGAHDNLAGSLTLDQLSKEVGCKLKKGQMSTPLPVEGVGKKSQIADQSGFVEMTVVDHSGENVDASYCAPLIADSNLPPLLGNKTLRRLRSLLDLGDGRLIVPGPGGVELTLSPGSRVFQLELTDSGHYVLPLSKKPKSQQTKRSDECLDFVMGVRRNKSSSPARTSAGRADN